MYIDLFLRIIFVFIVSCIPILLWGYFFSFADRQAANKKRFLFGILAGAIATFPILWLEKFYQNISDINIFSQLHGLSSMYSYVILFFSLSFLLACVASFFSFIQFCLKNANISQLGIFFRSFCVFLFCLLYIIIIFIILWVLESHLPIMKSFVILDYPIFNSTLFNSIKLITLYYFTASFLEESAKHYSFLQWNFTATLDVKQGVLWSIYIALWFSFFENIIYAVQLFQDSSIEQNIYGIIVFRSIFSLFIHVFASSILWYFFTKMYLKYTQKNFYLHDFFQWTVWLFLAIFIHASYNISTSFIGLWVVFLYFVLWYFWVSRIVFYNK